MTALEALILGIVQGATEFLPVSSSGHLVVGQALMGLEVPGVVFEAAVHVATLVSVVFVYRIQVGELVSGALRGSSEAWRYVGLLAVATVPAAAVGLLLRSWVEALFEMPLVVGIAFVITGGLLWTTRSAPGLRAELEIEGGSSATSDRDPGIGAALAMGAAQAFALVPGISRSGATVVVGLWLGVPAERAAQFSFLMAVPAITGAALLQLPEVTGGASAVATAPLLVGSLAAAVTGVVAIWTFVAMLRKKSFWLFAPYLWALAALFLGYLWWRGAP